MGKKILILEDDLKFSKVLPLFFRDTEFAVEMASQPDEALQKARQSTPAVILLNLDTANSRGYEVARKLKEAPETRKVPLILMSARKEEADIKRDTSLPAWQAYIKKPFVKKAILATVEGVVSNGGEAAEEGEIELELDQAFEGISADKGASSEPASSAAGQEEVFVEVEQAPPPAPAAARPAPFASVEAARAPEIKVPEGAGEPELRRTIKEMDRAMKALQRDKEMLARDLERRDRENEARVSERERELKDLEGQLQKKSEFVTQLSNQLKSVNEDLADKENRLRDETRSLRSERDELREKAQEQAQRLESAVQGSEDLTRNLSEAERVLAETEKVRDALQEKLRGIEERLSRAEQRASRGTQALQEVQAAVEAAVRALKD